MTENIDNNKLGLREKAKSLWRKLPRPRIKTQKATEPDPLFSLNRVIRTILETTSVIITLIIFWFGALGYLMNRETVDLAFFKPHYEQWFARAFDGRAANIELYNARWNNDRKTIELRAEDIDIVGKDGTGQYIAEIAGEFALGKGLWERPQLSRLRIDGGAITIVREQDGRVLMGLGTPETFQNVGALWTSGKTDRQNIVVLESGTIPPNSIWQRLETISVRSAKVFARDAVSDIKLTLDSINVDLVYDGKYVDILSEGEILTGEERPSFSAHVKSTLDRRDFAGEIEVERLNPIHIAPETGRFAFLANLDAPIDLEIGMTFLPERGFQDLYVDFEAGAGQLKTGSSFKPFQQARLKADYVVEQEHVEISDLQVTSQALNVMAKGSLNQLGTPETGFLKQPVDYDIEIDSFRVNPGQKFDGPIILQSAKARGKLNIPARDYYFDNLSLDFGSFQTNLSGRLKQGTDIAFEAIQANGTLNGEMSPEQLLGFWPNTFALGAREWVQNSVKTGILKDFAFDIAVVGDDLRNKQIADDHLKLTFNVEKADVQYMQSMPWLRDISGLGTMRGNSMDFVLAQGHVDELIVERGTVDIPRLTPKGGDFTIQMEGKGTASEMLRVTNNPPFEFAKKFGITPVEFGGSGNVTLKVIRPLRQYFDRSLIRYDLEGDFYDISMPVGVGDFNLNDGSLSLVANGSGIEINGPIKVGEWPAVLNWQKSLGQENIVQAKYNLTGSIGRDDLDAFGIGLRRHFGGEIGLVLSGVGDGVAVQSIGLEADFNDAEMNIGSLWQKAIGTPGSMRGQITLDGAEGSRFEDIQIRTDGIVINGSAALAPDFRLKNIDIVEAKIDGLIDAAVQAKPTEDGVLSLFLTGEYLNVEPWVDKAFSTQSSAITVAIRLTAALKILSLDENYQLKNASALFSSDGKTTQHARLKGDATSGPFLAEITRNAETGDRSVHINIPDAGRAGLTLLGLDSIQGGVLTVDGKLPPAGQAGGVRGSINLSDFTLVRAPAFTQILSLASLTGLADTLSGEGLKFNDFETQFAMQDGVFKLREARASGPALGLTADGDIGLSAKTMDLNGVLVPSYTMNSVLGDIPLVGGLIIGKKGEGLFALNYSIKGPFAATQVSVNPLSALTPGFLRRIFDVKRDDISDPDIHELLEKQKQDG